MIRGETRAPTDAELLRWLAKTCEERYPYRNGETLIEDWRPTDDTVRPVGYGVLRQLKTITDALTRELEEVKRVALPIGAWLSFVEAGRSLDGDEPLQDTDVLLNYSGNGASTMVTIGQVRALANVLSRERAADE